MSITSKIMIKAYSSFSELFLNKYDLSHLTHAWLVTTLTHEEKKITIFNEASRDFLWYKKPFPL